MPLRRDHSAGRHIVTFCYIHVKGWVKIDVAFGPYRHFVQLPIAYIQRFTTYKQMHCRLSEGIKRKIWQDIIVPLNYVKLRVYDSILKGRI